MKKINLEEIYNDSQIVENNIYGDEMDFKRICLRAMREACKQVLECAAENANMKGVTQHDNGAEDDYTDFVYVCDSNGPDYGYTVNKQSIMDTLKEIE